MGGIRVSQNGDGQAVIHWTFEPGWTWGDYELAMQQSLQTAQRLNQPVTLVFDLRAIDLLPQDTYWHLRSSLRLPPEQLRAMVVVSSHPFVRQLLTVFRRIYPHFGTRLLLADSLEQTGYMTV